ncbi:PTS system mannose/fructose/sorbose family transporter subunit IID [Escherichia coli]|uniref:PTS system mannose/fructose/sorbose family transporter subunit IID n=1 Tax=Escherichia coli TaxID=562 RepID=A0A376LBP5_ECOLX|nr:PTS system mannose/fructose/sorbose family transporter subunit IID [Escherichia coli]
MSGDVMQHELVERARESGALTKADITKAWFIYWLGAEVSSSYGAFTEPDFLRLDDADY